MSQLRNKKKLNIFRRAFPSGVVGVDNPMNKDSKIYPNASFITQNLNA